MGRVEVEVRSRKKSMPTGLEQRQDRAAHASLVSLSLKTVRESAGGTSKRSLKARVGPPKDRRFLCNSKRWNFPRGRIV